MPESKKLSELIDQLISLSNKFSIAYENGDAGLPSMCSRIIDIKNKIDQKFEELKCKCKEDKDGWEVTYMCVPTSNRVAGNDKIKSMLPDIDESCCMREGIEFSYYDGKLITMKCLKHKYASNSKKVS